MERGCQVTSCSAKKTFSLSFFSVSLNFNANINSLKACSERLAPLLKRAHSVKWLKRALLTLKFTLLDWSFGALVKVSTQRFDFIFSKLG